MTSSRYQRTPSMQKALQFLTAGRQSQSDNIARLQQEDINWKQGDTPPLPGSIASLIGDIPFGTETPMTSINQLPDNSSLNANDLLVIVQNGVSKKVTWGEIFSLMQALLGGAAGQNVPAGILKGSAGSFASALAGTDFPGLGTQNIFTVPQTLPVQDRGGQVFNVRTYGAKGDGTTDDTSAIRAAITAAGVLGEVWFPSGTYLVTDTIVDGSHGFCWRGARSERGGASPTTVIKFRPSDTTKYLTRAYDLVNVTEGIGPFTAENLTFDLGDANGFALGLRDINNDGVEDTVTDGSGQAYIVGSSFRHCFFTATVANRASNGSGVITRSGRYMIDCAKCFEHVIEDTTFQGGDIQVSWYGCDKPSIHECRSLYSHQPVLIRSSGGFIAQAVIDKFQVEGWTFSPVAIYNQSYAFSNCRFEENDTVGGIVPTGLGSLILTQTVSVTAGSAILTFSADMTGILYPYLTPIVLTDGTNTTFCYITEVNGTTVTIDISSTVLTWSNSAAQVTRYTAIGPCIFSINGGGLFNCDLDSETNCPALVWVAARGQCHVDGSRTVPVHTGQNALVVGNLQPWQTSPTTYNEPAAHLTFTGCSPSLVADTSSPFVVVTDLREGHGQSDYDSNAKRSVGHLCEDFEGCARTWVFTPKSYATYTANSYLTPMVKEQGDPNTSQAVWCWVKNSSYPIVLQDNTLPSSATSLIRIRIRAKMISGSGGLSYYFTGAGNNSGEAIFVVLTTTWTTYEYLGLVPSYWQGPITDPYGKSLVIIGGAGFVVSGVTIEEIPPGNTGAFPGGILSPSGFVSTYSDPTQVGLTIKLSANPIAVTNAVLASNTATLTVPSGNGMIQFQYVTISGVGAPYDGTWQLSSVGATSISYSVTHADIGSAVVSGTATPLTFANDPLRFVSGDGITKGNISKDLSLYFVQGYFSGSIGVNGATPPVKAASPGTASGSDAAVINAIITILRNIGFCS